MEEQKFRLDWISENRQGSFPCGEFSSWEEANAAIPEAKASMLDAGNDDDAEWLLAGSWEIFKVY